MTHRWVILILYIIPAGFLMVRHAPALERQTSKNPTSVMPTKKNPPENRLFSDRLEYVPNEIIVKFKESAAANLKSQLKKGVRADKLKLSGSLDEIKTKYQIRNIKGVFRNFKENNRRLERLAHKDKTLLNERDKRLLRRQRRAPPPARVPDLDRIYQFELELEPGQSPAEAAAAFQQHPEVEYAELNYMVSINAEPNDPLFSIQWPLNNTGQDYPESGRHNDPPGTPDSDIDAPEAWELHTDSSEVVIAVVDTGVDYNHRDLKNNIWVNQIEWAGMAGVDDDENGYVDDINGYDFINDDVDPIDDHGHGTHCAGVIAAQGNNNLDISGVCWNGWIMGIKFLGPGGSGDEADAARAIYYAVNNGADVISNSWGGSGDSETLRQAIEYAHSQGVVLVAAAGNDDSIVAHFPAYYEQVIAIAATDSNDDKASFSNYGYWVDLAAPGVDILSLRAAGTYMGKLYDSYTTIASGTSMACPHVAGACGYLLSVNPLLTNDQVRDVLMQSADPIAPGICASDGRLNLHNALLSAAPSNGVIDIENDVYSCSSVISILLADGDLAGNAGQQVSLETSGGDVEAVWLTEVIPTIGIFTGSISTGPAPRWVDDGILQITHDEIITAIYQDPNDGAGSPAQATDTARADCEYPLIFNVYINSPGPEPTVTFETSEPTQARVLCGRNCLEPNDIIRNRLLPKTHHTVNLVGVLPETDYFFIIEATDAAGNKTVDDNAGQCYTFTTTGPGDIYVPDERPTIQEAINVSWDSGTVWVADGAYTGNGNRDIDFLGRAITVRSENGPEYCIIDCGATKLDKHRGFYFHRGEGDDSVLDGLTIINGYINNGGGILCNNNSSPLIVNCIISQNTAAYGGGVKCYESSAILSNCLIIDNTALISGGAFCSYTHNPILSNCTLSGNSAHDIGGGIYSYKSILTVTNCILWGNGPEELFLDRGAPTITYNNVEGGFAGVGNINADPKFALVDDYHLMPGSPCLDAGDNTAVLSGVVADLEGNTRFFDDPQTPNTGNPGAPGQAIADMGAYEYNQKLRIAVSPVSIEYSAFEGGSNPPEQSLFIRNSGIGALQWQIEEICSWLIADPCQGASTGEIDEVIIRVNISGLTYGSYNCELIVTDPCALNSPRSIAVSLFINKVFHVPTDYPTIQAAIDLAQEGDKVLVEPGIYYESISFNGTNLIVTSVDPDNPTVVSGTVIQGNYTKPMVTFSGYENADCELTGFTIAGGKNNTASGGAVVGNAAEATISRCRIQANTTQENGGGIHDFDGLIFQCIIKTNSADINGGAMSACDGTISYCLIFKNAAYGAAAINNCDGEFIHCTIASNMAANDGALRYCDGSFTHCIIWDNSPVSLYACKAPLNYCCVQGGSAGFGNIDVNPLFVNVANEDFHLQSQGWRWESQDDRWTSDDVTSRCIDAGHPGLSLGDELLTIPGDPTHQRGKNLRINLGVYGGAPQASMPPHSWALPADSNNDGIVNLLDYALQVRPLSSAMSTATERLIFRISCC